MQNTLVTILMAAFGVLLLANVYFRVKSFRAFKKLAEHGIPLRREHLFNAALLEQEVLSRHPEHQTLVLEHIKSMKRSLRISTLCMVVITVCGGVLMYYRNNG